MSSSRRGRPSIFAQSLAVQTGRLNSSEAGRLNSTKVRKILGEQCALDDIQIENLTDGAWALADFAVIAFAAQREQCSMIASEQPVPLPEAAAPVVAVMQQRDRL